MTDGKLTVTTHDGDWRAAAEIVLPLCRAVFPGFEDDYLLGRLPYVAGRHLMLARRSDKLVGFKLAYGRGPATLYSWLGGVLDEARGAGVAKELMEHQHREAVSLGYHFVETRARAANTAMIILNLRSGFRVTGFEVDRSGRELVSLRKALRPLPSEISHRRDADTSASASGTGG